MKTRVFRYYLSHKCACDLGGAVVIAFVFIYGIVLATIFGQAIDNRIEEAQRWEPPTVDYWEWKKTSIDYKPDSTKVAF